MQHLDLLGWWFKHDMSYYDKRLLLMRLLFLVTEDWYFCSHRLPVARAARDAGFEVLVATRVEGHGAEIEREGFRLIPLRKMQRRGKNPFGEFSAVLEIAGIYRRERPDLVHHVALKPVIYGSIAARIARVPAVVNAMAGLGYVFSSGDSRARWLRFFVRNVFRLLLNRVGSVVLLQNPDDRRALVESGTVLDERTALIRGSGVDIRQFSPAPEIDERPVVITLVARMLRDKGVHEFVEAVRLLREQGVQIRAVLVGIPDPDNPTSIPREQLVAWHEQGDIEWWGRRDDIPDVWAKSHIAVLPTTYGEGVPKSLIEAAACGRPIIATDMPGCREIVEHEKTGLLVPPRDPQALADAIARLIGDAGLRKAMGQAGRLLVEREFSEAVVVEKTLALYRSLLGDKWPKTH